MAKSLPMLTPRIRPPMIAARKQPVPVAESQMKANFAPSGVGLGTTGASREILLCIGVAQPLLSLGFPSGFLTTLPSGPRTTQFGVVWMFIQSLTGLKPQRKTNTERIRNGNQATKVLPAEC